jgi:protein phosphatase
LEHGFLEANTAVRTASTEDSSFEGMGTTLVAARIQEDGHLQLANVGDSRAYVLSRGVFSAVTKDHTWVQEVGSRLGLSEEALRKHPMRHVLTMAIGISEALRVDCQILSVGKGDQILLCSDGLHGVVDEKVVEEVLKSEKSLPDKAHYLIEAAKERGGPDNITVVLIRVL